MDHNQLASLIAAAVAATLQAKPPTDPNFADLARERLAETKHRQSWRREIERLLDGPLAMLPPHPTRDDIGRLLRGLKAPSTHNHCLAIMGSTYRWGMATGRCAANPAYGFRRRPIAPRERTLTLDELRAVWAATDDSSDHSRITRLLLLSGQRAGEVGGLRWDEIVLDGEPRIELPGGRCKNHRPHIVPLSPLAVDQLPARRPGRPFVFGRRRASGFSGWGKCKAALDRRLTLAGGNWQTHDLRRSFCTLANELGLAPPHIIEAAVNHVSGHKAGVAGVYNKALYLAERRALMCAWAGRLLAERTTPGDPTQAI